MLRQIRSQVQENDFTYFRPRLGRYILVYVYSNMCYLEFRSECVSVASQEQEIQVATTLTVEQLQVMEMR